MRERSSSQRHEPDYELKRVIPEKGVCLVEQFIHGEGLCNQPLTNSIFVQSVDRFPHAADTKPEWVLVAGGQIGECAAFLKKAIHFTHDVRPLTGNRFA